MGQSWLEEGKGRGGLQRGTGGRAVIWGSPPLRRVLGALVSSGDTFDDPSGDTSSLEKRLKKLDSILPMLKEAYGMMI